MKYFSIFLHNVALDDLWHDVDVLTVERKFSYEV